MMQRKSRMSKGLIKRGRLKTLTWRLNDLHGIHMIVAEKAKREANEAKEEAAKLERKIGCKTNLYFACLLINVRPNFYNKRA